MKGGELAAWTALLVALPFLVVVAGGFLKFAVVLGALRQALGGALLPPVGVVGALALILAAFVAAPLGERVAAAVGHADGPAALAGGIEPVRSFLATHTPESERAAFVELARGLRAPGAAVAPDELMVLLPAYVCGQLNDAFLLALLVLLPFLVIDLLVGIALTTLGVDGLAPAAVALPVKLAVFVAADGWHLLVRGLIAGAS